MGMSFSHLLIVLLIIFVLFGAGKLPQVMSDLAKGLKAFKNGMQDDGSDNDKNK
ncbi:twin argininte translocase protein A [Rickettsia akari str. Hartford]|uniref:Sec-independent protein translocase protein TatA n=1 Tax=Rickettsia akari (strain Hartford) TaxID=293614 RepID=TATA_RICAH|nr:Sec-independent protein translocase subunit TatA [Rickettsia akari]A8GPQ1.1 RecName: Full=Sec-independent protein translocase protein TatA [Rickettsia akari str. Hartford]ABV75376.1 twin argininte translocase protein A [Rickettsia akari str. Hartford]